MEEDIKRQTKNTINYYKNLEKIEEIPIDILRAMYKDVLAEREQKDKRIQELEEALLKVKDKNTTLFITCRNSIPKQKVKDKIEENKDAAKRVAGTYQYADSGDDLEEKKSKVIELRTKAEALEELLEDK